MNLDLTEIAAINPRAELQTWRSTFHVPLGELKPNAELQSLLAGGGDWNWKVDDEVKRVVRDVLRDGGFKPTGRSKPASEYLVKAAARCEPPRLESINVAVDICNVASWRSGLPISVIDSDLAEGPLRVAVAEPGSSYVFNASGQSMDVGGLLCLFDANGPCANAVKDSQRTKTHARTTAVRYVIWGAQALSGRAASVAQWCQQQLQAHGAAHGE